MDGPKKSSLKRSILKKPSPLRAVHPDVIAENEEESKDDSQSEKPLAAKEAQSDDASPQMPSESKAEKVTLRPKLERNLKDSFRVSSDRLSSSSKSKFLKRRKRPDSASPNMSKIKENETSFPFPDPAKRSSADTSEPKSPKTHTILKVKAEIHEEDSHKRSEDIDNKSYGSIKGVKSRDSVDYSSDTHICEPSSNIPCHRQGTTPSESTETSMGEHIAALVKPSSDNPGPTRGNIPNDSADLPIDEHIGDVMKTVSDNPCPTKDNIQSESTGVSMGDNIGNLVKPASENLGPIKSKIPSKSTETSLDENIDDFVKQSSMKSDSVDVSMGENIGDTVLESSSDNPSSEMDDSRQMAFIEDWFHSPSYDGRPRKLSDNVCDMEEASFGDSHSRSAEEPCGALSFPVVDKIQNDSKTHLDIPIIIVDESDDMPDTEEQPTDICDRPDNDIRISVDQVEENSSEVKSVNVEDESLAREEQPKVEAKVETPFFQNETFQIITDEHVSDEGEDHRSTIDQGDHGVDRDGEIVIRQSNVICDLDEDLSKDDTTPVKIDQVPNYFPSSNNQIHPNEDSLMDFDEEESLV